MENSFVKAIIIAVIGIVPNIIDIITKNRKQCCKHCKYKKK